MKNSLLFPSQNIEYATYLEIVKNNVENTKPIFCANECVKVGMEALTNIDDPIKRQKMMEASIAIDNEYNIPYSRGTNASHKLAYILTIASMIDNYYELIQDLDNNELSLLSYFSYVVANDQMQSHLKLFGDKSLLNLVIGKTLSREEQSGILSIIENKYFEFAIDLGDEIEFNKFKNESIALIKNNSTEDLLDMVKSPEQLCQELLDKGIAF